MNGGAERRLLVGHHSNCYRLFNMSRERDAHAFRIRGARPTFGAGAPWSEIRSAAEVELARLGSRPPVAPTGSAPAATAFEHDLAQ